MLTFLEYCRLHELDFDGQWPSMPNDPRSDRGGNRRGLPSEPSDEPFTWTRDKKAMYHLNQTVPPVSDDAGIPVKLGYAVFNVFQRYWTGAGDPLYTLLSRRGTSVDWVTVFATPVEMGRSKQVAQEILNSSADKGEIGTAKHVLQDL